MFQFGHFLKGYEIKNIYIYNYLGIIIFYVGYIGEISPLFIWIMKIICIYCIVYIVNYVKENIRWNIMCSICRRSNLLEIENVTNTSWYGYYNIVNPKIRVPRIKNFWKKKNFANILFLSTQNWHTKWLELSLILFAAKFAFKYQGCLFAWCKQGTN